jgi:phenylacetate-coenzyme A ligase PaaK-like adenylate-forming protein
MLKNENAPWSIASDPEFQDFALRTFNHQYKNNPVYRQWVDLLKVNPRKVGHSGQIPFLPIEFFREFTVVTGHMPNGAVEFASSATTGQRRSKHLVTDVSVYEKSFLRGFRLFYGDPADYCILALLPGYLERQDSSLVYMCNRLIAESRHPESGFFLRELEILREKIGRLKSAGQKTLLIGVSYALMDLSDTGVLLDEHFIVMETGGMKGKRREMLKPELHDYLKKGFGVNEIHSEYGMTEMLSQAYSAGDGLFDAPPWLRFLVREVDDPLVLKDDGRTGGVNVIDLANINSCAFIATQDLGRLHGRRLELMGRFDNSDVRGCNLMVT